MESLVPDPSVIAEAMQLVSSLESHTGSPADQVKVVRQLDKLRCLLYTGPDALMFQAYPVWLIYMLYTDVSSRCCKDWYLMLYSSKSSRR